MIQRPHSIVNYFVLALSFFTLSGCVSTSGQLKNPRAANTNDSIPVFISGLDTLTPEQVDETVHFYNVQHPEIKQLFQKSEWSKIEPLLAAEAGNTKPQFLSELAVVRFMLGKKSEAIALFDQAGKSGFPQAHFNLAMVYLHDGDDISAERYFNLAIEAYGKGNSKTQLGFLTKIFKSFEKYPAFQAELRKSNNPTRFLMSGIEALSNEEHEKAIVDLKKAYALGSQEARTMLVGILATQNRLSDAESYIKAGFKNGEPDPDEAGLWALINDGKGNFTEAERYFAKAAKSGDADWQFQYGVFLQKRGKKSESEKFLKLAADQGNSAAKMLLGLNWAAKPEMQERSIAYLKSALAEGEENITAQVLVGEYLAKSGNFLEAITFLEPAVKAAPAERFNVGAKGLLAICLVMVGEEEKSLKYLLELQEAADNGDSEAKRFLDTLGELPKQQG